VSGSRSGDYSSWPVDVAALDVTTAKAGVGGDMWGGARRAKAEVPAVHEVITREVDIWVGRDEGLSSVLVLETEQLRAMQGGVRRMDEFSGRALIARLQEGGPHSTDLSNGSLCRLWHARRIRRWSSGLSRVHGRVALGEGAP
jgi:hypothetical protein